MTDHEIDRLLREASPLTSPAAAALDLAAAEAELLEEIMSLPGAPAGSTAPVEVVLAPPSTNGTGGTGAAHGVEDRRRRPGARAFVAAAAAGFLIAMAAVGLRDRGDDPRSEVSTEPTVPDGGGIPRLLADTVPAPFRLSHAGDRALTVDDAGAPQSEQMSHVAYYPRPIPGWAGVAWFEVEAAETDEPLPVGEPVTVRGHEGRLVVTPAGGPAIVASISVAWDEAPGIRATVTAANTTLTEADILAIAESLRAVSEEEWDRASYLDDPADPEAVEDEIPDDAEGWLTLGPLGGAVYLAADGTVCAFRVDNRGRFPDVCGDPAAGPHLLEDRIGWPSLVFGVLPDGATQVVATQFGVDITTGPQPPAGTNEAAVAIATITGGQRIYAVTVGPVPDTLTFLDDAGRTTGTEPLDIEPRF